MSDYWKGSKENIDRLLEHLKANSLAERLVIARREAEQDGAATAMKAVILTRLETLRGDLDSPQD